MISSLAIFLQSLNLIHLPAIEIYDISSQKVGYRYAGLGNSYAYESAYLWIGVSTVLGILFQKLKPKQMLFYLLITVIIFISAIFTGARTGYVAGFITSIYALYKNNLIRNIKNVVVTILIFTIFVGMIFTINKEFLSGGIISTLSGRLQLEDNRLRAWIDGLTVALSSPVIGVGNYQSAASSQGIVTIAHEQNGFIALINYSGILSFILYIFILLKIFQYLTNPHSRFDVLSTALINISLYTMIIYIIFMMTEIMYTSGQIQIIIFIIFGITLNYIRNAKPVENHCPHQRRPRQPTLLLCRCPSTGFGQRCGTGHR
ncbi:hypothetical protein DAMNIGENAA_38910 [Desulforhabdus amnigena]|uniref:O-antigen ligase-related domain-containing protein n=2 Tax=Desulforhabdus amnigena TaxID=40218 RepID=A0A9W6FX68_9BACT|nr:hypothetical protein DAMNIGENAA_38910 [Desulforhabdus amnigena]